MANNFGQSLRKQVARFLRDESAQATTEYILMLVAALSFFMLLYSKLMSPVVLALQAKIGQQIQTSFFNGNFHQLNIGH
jgi:Flp pilus assembly pilin Flp